MRLALILAASLSIVPAAQAEESIEFSGKLLIGLRARPDQPETLKKCRPEAWRFTPLFDTTGAEPAGPSADATTVAGHYWLVATPHDSGAVDRSDSPRAWDIAHETVDGRAGAPYGTLLADLGVCLREKVVPSVVEPDIYYRNRHIPRAILREATSVCGFSCRSDPECDELKLCSEPSVHWPGGEFAWHLRSDKSQLRKAREAVQEKLGDGLPRVFVVHVDTGYSGNDALLPPRFDRKSSLDFTLGESPVEGGEDPCNDKFYNQPGHGTKTLSVLAGKEGKVLGEDGSIVFNEFLGGAPRARVASYRVSDSVIHFFPRKLASAIAKAAENGADVVSISMGGFPSWTLRDAANEAYESGTAVFAAAGNSFKSLFPGVSSPTTTVYPARFSRVVAVTGVTANDRSYAKIPNFWSVLRGNLDSWRMRGNYGPAYVMEEAIAAYTPNISWSRMGNQNPSCLADLDGAGTSAATPQVAAAAALWLDWYRDVLEFPKEKWKKAEAVYRALFDSAKKDVPDPGYAKTYFGRGILQASDALKKKVPGHLSKRPPAEIQFGWLLPEGAAIQVARQRAHYRMMQVEMAQLLYSSRCLEKILGDTDPEDLPDDPKKLRRFLEAVRKDERASKYLKRALILNDY